MSSYLFLNVFSMYFKCFIDISFNVNQQVTWDKNHCVKWGLEMTNNPSDSLCYALLLI